MNVNDVATVCGFSELHYPPSGVASLPNDQLPASGPCLYDFGARDGSFKAPSSTWYQAGVFIPWIHSKDHRAVQPVLGGSR